MYSIVTDGQKLSFETVNHLCLGVGCLSQVALAGPETRSKPLNKLPQFLSSMMLHISNEVVLPRAILSPVSQNVLVQSEDLLIKLQVQDYLHAGLFISLMEASRSLEVCITGLAAVTGEIKIKSMYMSFLSLSPCICLNFQECVCISYLTYAGHITSTL